ncbi:transglycosylase SLT domain-containing protein [bacterium]|nr:transglycosylase SLT domain-containing protein [bacterium]
MIQNLISSGGHQAAVQRSAQLQNYINHTQVQEINKTDDIKSFAEVLKSSNVENSKRTGFGKFLQKETAGTVASGFGKFGSLTGIKNLSATTNSIPEVSSKAPKAQLLSMIDKVAQKHGVDEKLVRALIKQESGFNPNATSHCGAQGLMQLMPATAKSLGVKDAYNPVQNVEGGVKYLKGLLNRYNGNVILALAAYNAGPGAVDKYDGVPPYKETQNYVKSILANYL